MNEAELEVLFCLDGPAIGERVEIPVDEDELWRCVVDVGYCLYRRAPAGLFFAGKVLTVKQVADMIVERGATPWLHADGGPPRARRQRYERFGERDG